MRAVKASINAFCSCIAFTSIGTNLLYCKPICLPSPDVDTVRFFLAADRQGCVDRNTQHLEIMKAKSDWGSESMTATTNAITAATTVIG